MLYFSLGLQWDPSFPKIILVHQENSRVTTLENSRKKVDLVHCGSPIVKAINSQPLMEWFKLHTSVFQNFSIFFFVYDAGGNDNSVVKIFQEYVKLNLMDVADFQPQANYPSWDNGQLLAFNDCLCRSRGFSR